MPPAHQKFSEWNPGRFLNWAMDIGPATRDVIKHLLTKAVHPEQSYRACFGILASAKQYGKERLESACLRALAIGAPRRHSILSILKSGLDKQPLKKPVFSPQIKAHENIRGAAHYQNELSFSQTKP